MIKWPTPNNQGLTLLEVMIATLIFSMISVLTYSMLNRSFIFNAKGEEHLLNMEREYNLINLLRRQVQGAWYDQGLKKMHMYSETAERFSLITTASLMHPQSSLVVAFYEFNPQDATLYYTERLDFYNSDYEDDPPLIDEMIPLVQVGGTFSLQADPDSDLVALNYDDNAYTFHPFCTKQDQEDDFEP